jgi:hypothetical protein
MCDNKILLGLTQIIHMILILFVIIAPFTQNKTLIKYNIVLLSYFLFKWITGYNRCGLTEIEYLLSNKPYGTGFIHRLLNNVVNIEEMQSDRVVQFTTFSLLVVNILIYKQIEI